MKEFRDKNSLNDGGQINSVTNLNEMLNYVSLVKLNYIKYYDLVMNLFDKYFEPVKKLVKSMDEKYKSVFKTIKFQAYNSVDNIYSFIDLLKLFISQEKFYRISQMFNNPNNNHLKNANIEENDEEDNLKIEKIIDDIDNRMRIKKYVDIKGETTEVEQKKNDDSKIVLNRNENILFAFSLDPFQLIDVIRNINDDNLKEFYMLLFMYIFDEIDYQQLIGYLDRETKFTLLQKYKYCSTLLEEKEIIHKQMEKYEIEKSYFSHIYSYSKFMKDKVDKITEMRDKSLKRLKMDAEHDLKILNDKKDD